MLCVDILKATNGKLISGQKNLDFRSISTNSKKTKRGELFVPIVGKKHDGHEFIGEAFRRGAAGALATRPVKGIDKDKIIIKVRDTRRALQDIALFHRLKFRIPVIGVTGSSGKTTTKDMIASILSQEKRTLKSEGNLNNEYGVPLTLLKLNRTHGAAVIEMAMQRAGEIDELARVVLPNASVITNIGEAHMEFFRSKRNIALVKAEALRYLKRSDFAVLNADDEHFGLLRMKAGRGKVITFGIDHKASARALNVAKEGKSVSFDLRYRGKTTRIRLPLPGIHNVYNALAAAAACLAIGIKASSVRKGLLKFKPSGNRMRIADVDGIRVIDDSYNANPSSMRAALSVLSEQKGRRVAVLGDMLELGMISESSHRDLGKFAALKADVLVTKGLLSRETAKAARAAGLKKVYTTSSNEEASKLLSRILRKNDVVLVKGSRGMKMEEIIEKILG